jgi:hypothetical protein
MADIDFFRSPIIGRLWKTQKGFCSGYLFQLKDIKEAMEKSGIDENDTVKVFLFKNKNNKSANEVFYEIKVVKHYGSAPKNMSVEEMQERDYAQHEAEEAMNLPIRF